MLLYNTPSKLQVTQVNHPLNVNIPCFKINEYLPNPTLILYRGYTYEIDVRVDTDGIGPHSFEIKTARTSLGTGYYTDGVSSSSIYSGLIKWKVALNAPDLLIYQSKYDFNIDNLQKNMYGLIYIMDPPTVFPNTLKPIGLNSSFSEFVENYNYNMSTALTTNNNIAGQGLTWSGSQLSLTNSNEYVFFLDGNNNLISTSSAFPLTDGLTASIDPILIQHIQDEPKTLLNVINEIALLIRLIKDSDEPYSTAPVSSLFDLEAQVLQLQSIMTAIANRIYALDYRLAQGAN